MDGRRVAPVMSAAAAVQVHLLLSGARRGEDLQGSQPGADPGEIARLAVTRCGHILFVDDIFTFNPRRTENFCD